MKYVEIIKELSCRINKKLAVFVLVAISIIVFGFINWKAEELPKTLVQPAAIAQEPDLQNSVIYYYGEECARCKKLETFIDNNKITDKISLIKSEVWHNTANNADMQEKVMECLLDSSKVGVPFLWARGKCYEGEVEVQKFLKKEVGIL